MLKGRGHRAKTQAGPKMQEKKPLILSAGLVSLLYQYFCKRNYIMIHVNLFSFGCLAHEGAATLVRSLSTKSRNRLADDVLDTCATHADLNHDATDTVCQT